MIVEEKLNEAEMRKRRTSEDYLKIASELINIGHNASTAQQIKDFVDEDLPFFDEDESWSMKTYLEPILSSILKSWNNACEAMNMKIMCVKKTGWETFNGFLELTFQNWEQITRTCKDYVTGITNNETYVTSAVAKPSTTTSKPMTPNFTHMSQVVIDSENPCIKTSHPNIGLSWSQSEKLIAIQVQVGEVQQHDFKVDYDPHSLKISIPSMEYSLQLELAHPVMNNFCAQKAIPGGMELKMKKDTSNMESEWKLLCKDHTLTPNEMETPLTPLTWKHHWKLLFGET